MISYYIIYKGLKLISYRIIYRSCTAYLPKTSYTLYGIQQFDKLEFISSFQQVQTLTKK